LYIYWKVQILLNHTGLSAFLHCYKKIKHYEIATYGMLCFYARTLGETDAAVLLHKTLDQEKTDDARLSQIIKSIKLEMV